MAPRKRRSVSSVVSTQMTPSRRAKITALRSQGLSFSKIASMIPCALSTAIWSEKKWREQQSHYRKDGSGGPKLFSDREERRIIRHIRNNPKLTYKELISELQLPSTCQRTISRMAALKDIHRWRAARRPALTDAVARQRLSWARQRVNWSLDQWRKVVWSDECSVQIGQGQHRQWVFRKPGETWERRMIQPYPKGKQPSIMFWGAFIHTSLSRIVAMRRDENSSRHGVNAVSYRAVLEEQLPNLCTNGTIFMQDNAPIHTSRLITNWLRENGYETMPFPPYSPDLNPIENVWKKLKEGVDRLDPQLVWTHMPPRAKEERLHELVDQAWNDIEETLLATLVDSMPRRVQAVVNADGWYTKY